MENLPVLVIASAASNVYFGKRFSFSDDSARLAFLLAAMAVMSSVRLDLTVSLLAAVAVSATQKPNWEDWLNQGAMTAYLFWLCSTNRPDRWLLIVLLAVSQLIRNPPWLKMALRPFRVALGPVAVLNAVVVPVAYIGRVFGEGNTTWNLAQIISHTPLVLLCVVCAVSSLAAGLVFRPDNTELLRGLFGLSDLFGHDGDDVPKYPKYPIRKDLHAGFNMATVFCAGIMLLVEYASVYYVGVVGCAQEIVHTLQ